MSWVSKIDDIVCLNLPHREDRLLEFAKMMGEYEIPFRRVEAISKPNGAEGLRDTMVKLFAESLGKGHKQILVFEDDAQFVVQKEWVHLTMNEVIGNIPELWLMATLGSQITGKFIHRHHPNILSATKVYSTHAMLYSERGMRESLSQGLDYPIDNFFVDKLEPMRATYVVHPMLATQRPGRSDIYNNFIDWTAFIDSSYSQKYNEFNG